MPASPIAPVYNGRAGASTRPPSSASRWCSGFERRNRLTRLALRLDQPVPAVATAVDDVHLSGLVAAEDEEVVPDELELQRRLLGAHRLDRKLLRLDDLRAWLLVGDAHRTSGLNSVSTHLPAAALRAVVLHLAQQLVGQLIDRGLHVRRRLARAQRRALRPDGRLGDLVGRDRRIALDAELELHLRQGMQLTIELAQLFLGIPADRIADVDVLALHLESHRSPRGRESDLSSALAVAYRASERHDVDPSGASFPQGRRGRVGSGSGCIDIVDEPYLRGHGTRAGEGGDDVPPPLDPRQLALARRPPAAHKQRQRTELPGRRQLGREALGGVVATPEPPVRVGRDRYEAGGLGTPDGLDHDARRPRR